MGAARCTAMETGVVEWPPDRGRGAEPGEVTADPERDARDKHRTSISKWQTSHDTDLLPYS